ncbi:MAG: hypothetical protein LBK26_02645 [Rickettsiales bacterium]|jgi:hypothetical protein|nr:hypothetical protein [Rickettsiales bacterium]
MTQITKLQKAKTFGFWRGMAVLAAVLFPDALCAAQQAMEEDSFAQVIYTDTPVQSYYAYPDDVNFIPEGQFMMRADSLNYDDNIEAARMDKSNANPGTALSFADRPSIICRDFGCTRMNDRTPRTFLFNSLSNIFMMNSHSRMHICEADPFTRACIQSGISFPVRIGVANAMVKVPKITIDQVLLSAGLSKATIGMTFDMLVNGVSVRCQPTITDIVVPMNSQATLAAREFTCSMTSDGYTNVSLLFNMDYIDLDYGVLGGYYSLGMQGPAMGGGTGYALFKVESSNSGIKMRAAVNDSAAAGAFAAGPDTQIIRPGEYAVEPLEK